MSERPDDHAADGSTDEPAAGPADRPDEAAIPAPALVVLIGPSAAGKSTWAESNFREGQVLSSDHFRALVGTGADDQTAGTEAFAVLDQLIALRLAKGLTTVVDTLGLDDDLRARLRAAASRGRPALCRRRLRHRPHPLPPAQRGPPPPPAQVGARQATPALAGGARRPRRRGLRPRPARPRPTSPRRRTPPSADRQRPQSAVRRRRPAVRLRPRRVELRVRRRQRRDRTATGRDRPSGRGRRLPLDPGHGPLPPGAPGRSGLGADARELHHAGLPGRPHHHPAARHAGGWDRAPQRRPAGQDRGHPRRRLRRGRVDCGLGAGWFDAEQAAFGYPVNSNRVRLDTLEEALQALPILWGPGSKSFEGEQVRIPEALAYPRPLQDPVPIIVGGGGERRTLRLAARYATGGQRAGRPRDRGGQDRGAAAPLRRGRPRPGRGGDDGAVTPGPRPDRGRAGRPGRAAPPPQPIGRAIRRARTRSDACSRRSRPSRARAGAARGPGVSPTRANRRRARTRRRSTRSTPAQRHRSPDDRVGWARAQRSTPPGRSPGACGKQAG